MTVSKLKMNNSISKYNKYVADFRFKKCSEVCWGIKKRYNWFWITKEGNLFAMIEIITEQDRFFGERGKI